MKKEIKPRIQQRLPNKALPLSIPEEIIGKQSDKYISQNKRTKTQIPKQQSNNY